MRRRLLLLWLCLTATAHAQAQGGPEPTPTPETSAEAAPGDASAPSPAAAPSFESAPAPARGPDAEPGSGPPAEPVLVPATVDPSPQKTRARAAPPPLTRFSGPSPADENVWAFDFHGYFRAPMRVGVGKRLPEDTNGYTISGQSDTTLHEPVVPDDQYLSFQSTSHNPRAWAEGFFSYGNAFAKGTLGISSYNLTEAGFSDPKANLGISQAFLTLTPDLGFDNVRLWAKAGVIVDKYGMSGRYDAGEYDTYMFGRTHVAGETLHLEYDLDNLWTLWFEQGLGTHKPDPNQHNNARFTLLHHEHVGLKRGRDLEFGLHYLDSWSQEEFRPFNGSVDANLAPRNGLPNGKLWVAGVEARAELGAFGYLYGAYSHVGADYALTVSRAVEVLHASGGGEFDLGVVGNYLESPNCAAINNPDSDPPTDPPPPQAWDVLDPNACSDGNGALNAFHAQYEFSLTNFTQQIGGGPRFWGQGFDVILKLYGMLVLVDSEARDTTQVPVGGNLVTDAPEGYHVKKQKYGADLGVQLLPWLSPGVRFDRVEPNDRVPEQSFAILSPRLAFKTAWVTHERITLGYSRYFYDQRVCSPETMPLAPGSSFTVPNFRCVRPPSAPVPYDGFGSTPGKQDDGTRATGPKRPDQNVFKVEATMWW